MYTNLYILKPSICNIPFLLVIISTSLKMNKGQNIKKGVNEYE